MRLLWKSYLATTGFVLSSAALLTSGISVVESQHEYAQLRQQHKLLATLVASQVEAGYHEELWPFEMLRTIAQAPSFKSWQIVDGLGNVVLADTWKIGSPRVPRNERGLLSPTLTTGDNPDDDFEAWIVPMRMRTGRVPWTFRLGYSTRSVSEHVHMLVAVNALMAAAVAVLLLPLSLLLTRRTLRPLEALTRSVRQMEAGALDAPLPAVTGDEVGELIGAFGAMSGTVRAAQHELEHRVELRTAELAKSTLSAEQTAASLARSNAQMQAIHRTSLDAVLVLDAQWQVVGFNPAAQRMFGCAEQRASGKPLTAFVASAMQSAGSDEATPFVLGRLSEVRAARLDGTTFPAEMAVTAAEMDGPPLYVVALRDLSERKRIEDERDALNQRLLATSRQAGMAEVATGVLHNIGNVLNSVNVSAQLIRDRLQPARHTKLSKAASMIENHRADLASFFTADPKGQQLPRYLTKLAEAIGSDQSMVIEELGALSGGIDHIKQIVQMQQDGARGSNFRERVRPRALLEDAVRMNTGSLERHQVRIDLECDVLGVVELDKHKMLQVLVNLISNAKNAMKDLPLDRPRRITLRLTASPLTRPPAGVSAIAAAGSWGSLRFEVIDTGAGILRENLDRIFTLGFTTRKSGHGFGLHSAANAAREMNGTLTVASEGPGTGATFTLEVPVAWVPSADARGDGHLVGTGESR